LHDYAEAHASRSPSSHHANGHLVRAVVLTVRPAEDQIVVFVVGAEHGAIGGLLLLAVLPDHFSG
jgi:hypothetical protein